VDIATGYGLDDRGVGKNVSAGTIGTLLDTSFPMPSVSNQRKSWRSVLPRTSCMYGYLCLLTRVSAYIRGLVTLVSNRNACQIAL
jgi:hypothetical protein